MKFRHAKRHLRRPRLRLPKRRLRPLDVASAVGIFLLTCYLAFFEENEPLKPTGEVQTLSGWPEIVDGDSIKIKGVRVRLVGIDAPEMGQYCLDDAKKRHPCGIFAKKHLEKLIQNRPVTCRWQELDRYDRILGLCQAGDDNLNRLMVENGWAFSYYSSAYDNEQKLARSQKIGMWVWRVQQPQKWRRDHPRR